MDDISKVYIYLLNDTIIENLQDINNMSIVMLKGEKGDGAGTWGEIDGNIAHQTDLQNALSSKANQSALNTTNANVSTNASNIATLQAEVSAFGNGSPEVVETVAEMIDTTKTYLYVGTETGYTSGNWYYYDGSDWVSGGAYGSNGGGISDNARNLLKYVLERVAYTETGMQIYINALYEALKLIDSPPTETFTILNTLVNVTNSNGATSIASGSAYSATLSVESGYTWGTVTITMGGTDITSTAYNSSTHEISIASVTGDLVIVASATAPVTTYTITNALSHVSNSNTSASVQANSSYSGTLTADTDYEIDSVTVTMGNVDITSTAYTSATGVISIASVTGDIVITASAILPDTRFEIEYRGNYTISSPSNTRVTLISKEITIAYGETLTISAENGYVLYALTAYGCKDHHEYEYQPKGTNQQYYVIGVNNATSYEYATNEMVVGSGGKLAYTGTTWNTGKSMSITNSAITSLTFSGFGVFVEKGTTSSHGSEEITIDEAKSAISWTIS